MKRRRWFSILCALLVAGWLIYFVAGTWLAQKLAIRIGTTLMRFGEGKFNDPAWFIQNRLWEALWLATLAMLWMLVHRLLAHWLQTRIRALWQWVFHAAVGFILLNVWVGFAAKTVLFWGALGAGAGVENFMQFQFKRTIASEVKSPLRAVLLGSSQTRAQIDERLLNEQLGRELWTTELHFPGSAGYDLLLVEPQLRSVRPQFVICYFTEGYLYTGLQGDVSKSFFSFSQFSEARRHGALGHMSAEQIGYGLLGSVLPVFRCRAIVSQRVLGSAAMNLRQASYDAGLDSDLDGRAAKMAKAFQMDARSDIQKIGVEEFVTRCEKANQRIIFLVGDFNPALSRQLDPGLRPDMLKFLQELKSRHSSLTLVSAPELPTQAQADYDDLSHVNRDAQRRFTEFLADFLKKQPELKN